MKKNLITMMNDYVLIKDLPLEENITETGIILPKQIYQRTAEIIAAGENSKFKPGDIILKPIGRTTPVTIDDIEYECLKEELIFAKL